MSTPTTYQLYVKGMSCQHCVKAITQAVHDQDGQALVNIDLDHGQVTVETVLSREDLNRVISEEGYEVVA